MATGQFLAGFEQLLLLIKQVLVVYHERRHPAGPNIWYAHRGLRIQGSSGKANLPVISHSLFQIGGIHDWFRSTPT